MGKKRTPQLQLDLAEGVFASLTTGVAPGGSTVITRDKFKSEIPKVLTSLIKSKGKQKAPFSKTVTKLVDILGLERASIVGESHVRLTVPVKPLQDQHQAGSNFFCAACQRQFISKQGFESHKSGMRHRKAEISVGQAELLRPKGGLVLERATSSPSEHPIVTTRGKTLEMLLKLTNTSNQEREIQRVYNAVSGNEFRFQPVGIPFLLKPGYELTIKVPFSSNHFGTYNCVIIVACKGFKIGHHIQIDVKDSALDYLAASSPFDGLERPSDIRRGATIIKSEDEPAERRVDFKIKLDRYPVPKYLKDAVSNGRAAVENVFNAAGDDRIEILKLQQWLEEIQMDQEILNYTIKDAKMTQGSNGLLYLPVPGLAEKRPSVLRGDRVLARSNQKIQAFEGIVKAVARDGVSLRFSKAFHDSFINGSSHTIQFSVNTLPSRRCHQALALLSREPVERQQVRLQPGAAGVDENISAMAPDQSTWYNRRLNDRQKQAVNYIVSGHHRQVPYILFGPPGTGKTTTIIEAILQLARDPKVRILLTAPSNNAADLIVSRLDRGGVKSQNMFRLNALSRTPETVPEDVRRFCHEVNGEFGVPADVQSKQIVVSTCISAGMMYSLDIGADHFTHIFIDEAAQATEQETITAFSGFGANSRLILSGDPKQLGPIIMSALARARGMDRSLMERLMLNEKCYERSEVLVTFGKYNPIFVTKLVDNYRSHPKLLDLPSKMFYDTELKPCGERVITESFCGWEVLPNKQCPLIFHSVPGKDEREGNSPSFFNVMEVSQLVWYVKQILEYKKSKVNASDIGIITPYHKQVQKIRQALQKELRKDQYENLSVGSVEQFQGQERRVIIISTVRSSQEWFNHDARFNLGFLKNFKRMNVAITRAQALLVVVGSPEVLRLDNNWLALINYAIENKCYVGPEMKNLEAEDAEISSLLRSVTESAQEEHPDDTATVDAVPRPNEDRI